MTMSRHPLTVDLILLVAWPLGLLLIDTEWAFTPLGGIDPWVYLGTFVNFTYNLSNFSQTYYVGRLSWILPGYVAHALLPPVAAAVSLHLSVLYAATLGCYFCLRTTVGRRSALTVSVLLGGYQPLLDAVGWDYVDGAGIAYFFLACAAGTAAIHGKRPLLWSALSGALAGACLITNVAWLMLMPGFVIYLAWLSSGWPFVQRARLVLAIGAGAAAMTTACALVFATITGIFWFFLPSFTVSRVLMSQPNPWQSASYAWVWDSPLLGTACVVYLLSLIAVVKLLVRADVAASRAPHAVWLWTLPVMLLVQLSGTPVLQFPFYASYLIPGLALSTGALLADPLQRASLRGWVLPLAIAAAVWLLVFASPSGIQPFGEMARFGVAAASGVLAAIALRVSSRRSWTVAVGLACILVVLVVHRGARAGEPGERELNYRLTLDALERLVPIQLEKPFYFWYSDAAPRAYRSVYQSVASCYLWGYRLFSAQFPARTTPNGTVNHAQSGQRIVLLTETPQKLPEIEEKLGAEIRVVREGHVARDGLSFNMLVFDVR
jgi:MFS family permease